MSKVTKTKKSKKSAIIESNDNVIFEPSHWNVTSAYSIANTELDSDDEESEHSGILGPHTLGNVSQSNSDLNYNMNEMVMGAKRRRPGKRGLHDLGRNIIGRIWENHKEDTFLQIFPLYCNMMNVTLSSISEVEKKQVFNLWLNLKRQQGLFHTGLRDDGKSVLNELWEDHKEKRFHEIFPLYCMKMNFLEDTVHQREKQQVDTLWGSMRRSAGLGNDIILDDSIQQVTLSKRPGPAGLHDTGKAILLELLEDHKDKSFKCIFPAYCERLKITEGEVSETARIQLMNTWRYMRSRR